MLRVDMEHSAVNRLKIKCAVIKVDYLAQRIARGVLCSSLGADAFLQRFIACLCRCKRVISVSHGK